ncbi:MAG TPA: hypothetical protein VMB26_17840 [Candidatus Binataceae bacterium]|nr:hypothetical protein [Candidatus Binataceae bacterium]
MHRRISIGFLTIVLLIAAGPLGPQFAESKPTPKRKTICPSADFAFCEAATCTATGRMIEGDGGTFPEASCLCPVIHGPAVASLHAGNMQGSCDPPPDGVWSLFPPNAAANYPDIPQASANWQSAPTPTQDCPASVNGQPVYFAGCFAYACKDYGTINGTRLAQCFCRMLTTNADEFATQAGQCNPDACNEIPEGVTRSHKLGKGRQCGN